MSGAPKPRGRPKSGKEVRDHLVSFYLTEADAEYFRDVAVKLGFKSRSEFFTAIAERLAIGSLSVMVFLKLGLQLSKRIDERGLERGPGFYFGLRPLPPLPDEELAAADYRPILEHIKEKIRQAR